MAQHDYVIDDQNGLSFLADLNDVLAAIVSNNSGATEPAETYPYQFWADTTAGVLKIRNAADLGWVSLLSLSTGTPSGVGTTIQPYDADTAKTDVAQDFTAPQRSTPLTDNDLSFDLAAKQNFTATPTGAGTLTFTNISAGLNGNILLVNGSNYAIAKAANVKCNASFLNTISASGTYWISYYSDGTNVYVSTAGAMS